MVDEREYYERYTLPEMTGRCILNLLIISLQGTSDHPIAHTKPIIDNLVLCNELFEYQSKSIRDCPEEIKQINFDGLKDETGINNCLQEETGRYLYRFKFFFESCVKY